MADILHTCHPSRPEYMPEHMTTLSDKLWGGRFSEPTHAFVEAFTASVSFDQRLYSADIRASIAHAQMLSSTGVLGSDEFEVIEAGLREIHTRIEAGEFEWREALEDVHMNLEAALTERIGETGKKLHTGRSRNDQVATAMRLCLRDEIDRIRGLMNALGSALANHALAHAGSIMPGYTHLQPAQCVTLGHHLLAWLAMLERDRQRLDDLRKRVNQLPLGSAALAGTSVPIDRHLTARLLGFDGLCENSLDAVSDRDFMIEFAAFAAMLMMHLSRWCEELILWSCEQFQFVMLADRFTTGSSIMPQKKNPDVPELIRGKTGRVYGHLMALLTLMKSQPLAYNRDNQEDKEPLFDTIDTVTGALSAMHGICEHLTFNTDTMRAAAGRGLLEATDLAEYLVQRGVAFRDAHHLVGEMVQDANATGRNLAEFSLDELQAKCPLIEADVLECLTPEGSVRLRDHVGGTAPAQVRQAAIKACETWKCP